MLLLKIRHIDDGVSYPQSFCKPQDVGIFPLGDYPTLPSERFWTEPVIPKALAIVTTFDLYPPFWTFPETVATSLLIEDI